MVEAQTAYVRQALTYLRRRGLATIEPNPAAQAGFLAEVDEGTRQRVDGRRLCQLVPGLDRAQLDAVAVERARLPPAASPL